jgi:hypothetical protein
MQAEDMVAPESKWQLRVLNGLAEKGIAHAYGGPESPIFSLASAWQDVDVSRKLPKWVELDPIDLPEKRGAGKELKPAKLKRPSPDPPKPADRPPATYSNSSWEDNISRILNTPI